MSDSAPPDSGKPEARHDDLSYEVTLRGLRAGQKVFSSRYTLIRILGRGGMGVVWLARDEQIQKDVALKFLPEFVALDRAALNDLREETKKTLDLTHPHIVRTYTFHTDTAEELAAIAMEVVEGGTLSDLRLEKENKVFEVTDADFRKWLGQLCGALAYAHVRKRIVHRDLKPGNLMVDRDGDIKVTDFGIARSLSESRTRLTRQASSSGTLPYMSPQQAMGERASESDDIYSLGATLYELLTGKPPFYAGEIYEQVKTKQPVPLKARREELDVRSSQMIPPAWEKAILACLAKEPADRPASAAELLRLLGLEMDGSLHVGAPVGKAPVAPPLSKKERRSKTPLLVVVAVIVITAGAAGWWFGYEQPSRQRVAAGAQAIADQTRLAENATAARDFLAARNAWRDVLALEPQHRHATESLRVVEAMRGGVEVGTHPAGAKVRVAGTKDGVSPAVLGDLPLGNHGISITLPGYEPIEETVTLRNDLFLPVERKMVRQRGSLALSTVPAVAAFSARMLSSSAGNSDDLDFQEAGETPVTLDSLPTGEYEITFTRKGWPSHTNKVVLKSGASTPVGWEFSEGSIVVESEPSSLSAEILDAEGDTLAKGPTPLRLFSVPVGPSYRVRITRPGWPDVEEAVTVSANTPTLFSRVFQQGEIIATVEPAESVGSTRIMLSRAHLIPGVPDTPVELVSGRKSPVLPAGEYQLTFTRPSWPAISKSVTLAGGEPLAITHQFRTGTLRIESTPPGVPFTVRQHTTELEELHDELARREAELAGKPEGVDNVRFLKKRIALLQEKIPKLELVSGMTARSGKTPATIDDLQEGAYEVLLTPARTIAWRPLVSVSHETPVAVSWQAGRGRVIITSDPDACEVWNGKEKLGVTPGEFELDAGTHMLTLRHPALGEKNFRADTQSGQTGKTNVKWPHRTIQVTTEPPGARVERAGKREEYYDLVFDEKDKPNIIYEEAKVLWGECDPPVLLGRTPCEVMIPADVAALHLRDPFEVNHPTIQIYPSQEALRYDFNKQREMAIAAGFNELCGEYYDPNDMDDPRYPLRIKSSGQLRVTQASDNEVWLEGEITESSVQINDGKTNRVVTFSVPRTRIRVLDKMGNFHIPPMIIAVDGSIRISRALANGNQPGIYPFKLAEIQLPNISGVIFEDGKMEVAGVFSWKGFCISPSLPQIENWVVKNPLPPFEYEEGEDGRRGARKSEQTIKAIEEGLDNLKEALAKQSPKSAVLLSNEMNLSQRGDE